ncbi:ankyrin repeat-containing domain protein [Nemania sp. FL0916]|nr:ankyrin repeat-containing domain protein [Nemania sp. FL0916]
MPSSQKVAREGLLRHKLLIRRLYLERDMSPHEVVAQLGEVGLNITRAQLEYQLKNWNFKKNLNEGTWKRVSNVLGKRKREGKESEMIHHGKRVKRDKIAKEVNRYRDRPTLAPLTQPQSPPPSILDSQVVVCTPQPLPMEFQSPDYLPWLDFINGELYNELYGVTAYQGQEQQVEGPIDVTIRPDKENSFLSLAFDSVPNHTDLSRPVSRLAATIGATMPEAYPEEHLRRSQTLLQGSRDRDFVFECLTLLIYVFSNNLMHGSSFPFSLQWKTTMTIIKASGLLHLTVDFKTFNSVTINGFSENLFRVALYEIDSSFNNLTEPLAVITWLLKCGLNPNDVQVEHYSGTQHPFTPLQLAIEENEFELVECLLEAKSDPNLVPSCYGSSLPPLSPLEIAQKRRRHEMTRALLEHGASANIHQTLHLAIRNGDLADAQLLLDHGADPFAAYKATHGLIYEETALTVAAATGLRELQFVLKLVRSRAQDIIYYYPGLITVDTLVAAATNSDSVMFLLRQQQFLDFSEANGHGITPLHAALRFGDVNLCELLLTCYDLHTFTTQIPPLWLACAMGDVHKVILLINHGSHLDCQASLSDDHLAILDFQSTPFHSSLEGRLNSTPLACIINGRYLSQGHLLCATTLIKSGATLTGYELFVAAYYGHLDLLTAALLAGANPSMIDREQKSPLQYALEFPGSILNEMINREMVHRLSYTGVVVTQADIMTCIQQDDLSLLEFLLGYGGNLIDKNQNGVTPMEESLWCSETIIAEKIFKKHPKIYDAVSICIALYMKKYSLAERLMANRPTQKFLNSGEMTALGLAAAAGSLKIFRKYLENLVSTKLAYLPPYATRTTVNRRFWHSRSVIGSPLAIAAYGSSAEARTAFEELLKRNFEPDEHTWLSIAKNNRIAHAQTLVDQGYVLPYDPDQSSLSVASDPICESIRNGFLDLFIIFLKVGTSLIRHHPHSIHLLVAIEHNKWDMVERLLAADANVNGYQDGNYTVLGLAAKKGNAKLVDRLLKVGADVNICSGTDMTALQHAAKAGEVEIVDRLLEAGANVNAYSSITALQSAARRNNTKLVERLLKAGADATICSGNEKTALQHAVEFGEAEMVERLLEAGANVNQWNPDIKNSRTPLQSAVEQVDLKIIDRLLNVEPKADVNAPAASQGGATALQLAAMKGHLGLAKYLIELGANIDAPGAKRYGRTALEGAAEYGRIDMLQLLLSRGAHITDLGRPQYVRSVMLASSGVKYHTAIELLRAFGGWSDSDEQELEIELERCAEERREQQVIGLGLNMGIDWDIEDFDGGGLR